MKLKVCGINNADFAVKAAELGVDYLGFIFHPASPRNVMIEEAKAIGQAIAQARIRLRGGEGASSPGEGASSPGEGASSPGEGDSFSGESSFGNTSGRRRPRLLSTKTLLKVGVFVRQSVGEILETMRAAALDVVQLHRRATAEDVAAIRAAGYEVWTLAGGAPGDGVLFDSSHGDGETDFRKGDYTAILAGRIGVDNLAEALALKPDLLDVNSSLETAPGVKSIDRLVRFLDSLDAETALCL